MLQRWHSTVFYLKGNAGWGFWSVWRVIYVISGGYTAQGTWRHQFFTAWSISFLVHVIDEESDSPFSATDRVIFLPGTFQNVSVSQNETVQAMVPRIAVDVAFVTLQFHTQHRNATLSYTRVRTCCPEVHTGTALSWMCCSWCRWGMNVTSALFLRTLYKPHLSTVPNQLAAVCGTLHNEMNFNGKISDKRFYTNIYVSKVWWVAVGNWTFEMVEKASHAIYCL